MPVLIDLTPLRTVAYRRLLVGDVVMAIGTQLTTVAVGLEVYDLTGDTFAVGLTGLFALVPLVAVGLYGGAVVDAMDRRRVIVWSTLATMVVSLLLAGQALAGLGQVWLLYLLVAAQSGLFGLTSPARGAAIPRLLPPELLPAANAMFGLTFGISAAVGPVLAGFLVGHTGFASAYVADAVLIAVAVVLVTGLPPIPPEGHLTAPGLRSILDGFRFLSTRPNVRMTFLVDLAAMILAMPRVLFPTVAAVAIGGGATSAGLLAAAVAVGAAVAGLFSGPLGGVRHQGRAVVVSIVVWGLAVSAFGLVVWAAPGTGDGRVTGVGLADAHWTLWPAALCLAVAGAADSVSAVFRITILQSATPDEMRGRLQGIFISVVAGGPRLGDVVLGGAAALTTAAVAATGGGLACIVVVLLLVAWQRGFLRYDARDPQP